MAEYKKAEDMGEVKGNFSVGLGLLDYINPIFYTVTSITLLINLFKAMSMPMYIIYGLGVLVSLIFGFSIPTVKVMVGMGKMKFSLPINLVSYVNTGIFVSGLMLLGYTLHVNPLIYLAIIVGAALFLYLALKKSGKINTVAVLIGAIGYLLIYISLITLSIRAGVTISIVFYAIAICLYVALVTMGVKGDVMNAKLHWVIESCNICCQGCVAIGTILLFK